MVVGSIAWFFFIRVPSNLWCYLIHSWTKWLDCKSDVVLAMNENTDIPRCGWPWRDMFDDLHRYQYRCSSCDKCWQKLS